MSDAEVSPGFRIETYTAPETIPADTICRVLVIPNDLSIIAAVSDVLAYLSRPFTWETDSEEQEIQMRAVMAKMVYTYFYGDCEEPMIGELRLFVASILPSNVLVCDGSEYNQADYPTLAAILPASLKDDVAGTFVTPNLSGRFPMGSGGGFAIGDTGGAETNTLTAANIPPHHQANTAAFDPGEESVEISYFTGETNPPEPPFSVLSGDSTPTAISNMPPYFAVKFGIVAR